MSEWISVKDRLPRERQVVVLGFFDRETGDINEGDDGDCLFQIGTIRTGTPGGRQ